MSLALNASTVSSSVTALWRRNLHLTFKPLSSCAFYRLQKRVTHSGAKKSVCLVQSHSFDQIKIDASSVACVTSVLRKPSHSNLFILLHSDWVERAKSRKTRVVSPLILRSHNVVNFVPTRTLGRQGTYSDVGSKTRTHLYRHEVRAIQQRHLPLIFNIKWNQLVSNKEVLKRADVEDIEPKLARNRLRWLRHFCCMDDNRPVKQRLYCELACASRPVVWPTFLYRDT